MAHLRKRAVLTGARVGAYKARMRRLCTSVLGSLLALRCGGAPAPIPAGESAPRSTSTVAAPAQEPRPASCARWTGRPPPATAPLAGDPPITAVLDLERGPGPAYRQELQALADASVPDLARCGLRPADLRAIHLVVTRASVIEARVLGLPALAQLRGCPLIPDLLAAGEARGWFVSDAGPGALRVRRAFVAPLPEEAFAFDPPAGRWLHARATVGPPARAMTVTFEDSDEHGALLRIEGPPDVVDAAGAWCRRAAQRPGAPDLGFIGACLEPAATTLEVVPSAQELADVAGLTTRMRAELFETFEVHGDSMVPTLRAGDVVFVDKLRRGEVPARGAIVVFAGDDGEQLIKRVIALPGEALELSAAGLHIDGRALPARATADSEAAEQCGATLRAQSLDDAGFEFIADADPVNARVPDGHVFVLGDNRPASKDSRTIGPVAVQRIAGVARFIAWSAVDRRVDWDRSGAGLGVGGCANAWLERDGGRHE